MTLARNAIMCVVFPLPPYIPTECLSFSKIFLFPNYDLCQRVTASLIRQMQGNLSNSLQTTRTHLQLPSEAAHWAWSGPLLQGAGANPDACSEGSFPCSLHLFVRWWGHSNDNHVAWCLLTLSCLQVLGLMGISRARKRVSRGGGEMSVCMRGRQHVTNLVFIIDAACWLKSWELLSFLPQWFCFSNGVHANSAKLALENTGKSFSQHIRQVG